MGAARRPGLFVCGFKMQGKFLDDLAFAFGPQTERVETVANDYIPVHSGTMRATRFSAPKNSCQAFLWSVSTLRPAAVSR